MVRNLSCDLQWEGGEEGGGTKCRILERRSVMEAGAEEMLGKRSSPAKERSYHSVRVSSLLLEQSN